MGVPIAHGPEGIDVATGLSLDPRTHLGVTLGSFFNVSKKWDMYVTTAWVDRGDAEKPATQLPILDGGFDQVQLAVGIIAHWSFDRCGPDDRDPDCPDRDQE
jgi:hypothetical protein